MERTSTDVSRKRSLLDGVEPWERSAVRKKRTGLSCTEQCPISVNQSTQESTLSVADSTVAGAIRCLGLSISDQRSAALSMDMDHHQDKGDKDLDQLSMLAKELGVSSEELKTFQDFQRNPQHDLESSLSLSHEKFLKIAGGFKRQADTIGKICTDSPVKKKSHLYNEFCTECRVSKGAYNECKDKSSCTQGDVIKALTRYQEAVALFSKFIINYTEHSKSLLPGKEELEQFIKIYSDISGSVKKQETLEKYRAMFEKCSEKIEHFQNEHNEKKEDIVALESKVNYVKIDIVALGNMLRQDCLQPDTHLPLLEMIEGHMKTYDQAMTDCRKARKDIAELGQFLVESHLSDMIKAVKDISKDYLQLTELARKGKGLAVGSPVTDHRDQREESGSDSESESKDSGSAMDVDSAHNSGSESNEEERSAGSVSIREADKEGSFPDKEAVTDPNDRESVEDRKRRDEKRYDLEILKIAQGKLEIYMRDSTYLSPEQIKEVGIQLSKQLIDIREKYLGVCGQENMPEDIKADPKKIQEYFEKLDQKKPSERYLTLVLSYQKELSKQLKTYSEKSGYSKEFSKFNEQVEQLSELKQDQMKKNLEAYKAEVGARELGSLFLKERGEVSWGHTTFAVAYMNDRHTGETHAFISVNESLSGNSIGKILQKYRDDNSNERFTLVKREGGKKSEKIKHAEEVLLGYAKHHKLKIQGIGASRKSCSNCSKLLEQLVEQKALGQNLFESDEREKSSKHWGGIRTGGSGNVYGVKLEIDDKDTYILDGGQDRVFVGRNMDSADLDKQKRKIDLVKNIGSKDKSLKKMGQ